MDDKQRPRYAPLTEGSLAKGGVNSEFQTKERPAAPDILAKETHIINTLGEFSRDGKVFASAFPFTFALVKTHIAANEDYHNPLSWPIIQSIKNARFTVVTNRKFYTTPEIRQEFYKEHIDKFYWRNLDKSITKFVLLLLLYKPEGDAILEFRKVMGATDPTKAEPGTLRYLYGEKDSGIIANNAIHGSDSYEAFLREIKIFWG